MNPDFAVFSYPKCGRTWLRFLLGWYLNDYFDLQTDIDFHSIFKVLPNYSNDAQRGVPAFAFGHRPELPKVVFSHLPVEPNLTVPVIFLSRCPLDTLVSEYFQKKNRQKVFTGSASEYLQSPDGLARLSSYYSHSCASLVNIQSNQTKNRILLLSYEQLHANTTESLRSVLSITNIPFDEELVSRAIEQSSFDRMRQTEIQKGFPSAQARGQMDDPNALRAREGKIGGHRQHLTPEEIRFARDYLNANLSESVRQILPGLLANIG